MRIFALVVAIATLGSQAYVAGSPVGTELVNTAEPTADATLTDVVGAGVTAHYTLDGAGNRWAQTINGLTTSFDLDLAAPDPTVLADGTRTYLPADPAAGYAEAGTWWNALATEQGSPITSVSETGATTSALHYDPYGRTRPGSSDPVGIGFAGEWQDPSGLVNLRARAYDPLLGRFISRDTFAGVLSAPQTAHRYAYALANPLRYRDPSGHFVGSFLQHPGLWTSMALQSIPGSGDAYSALTAATGFDPIAGLALTADERLLAGASALAPGAFTFAKRIGHRLLDTFAESRLGWRLLGLDREGGLFRVGGPGRTGNGWTARDFVQEIATRAQRRVGGTGAVAGTVKHAYAAKLIERYQSRFGRVGGGLETEVTYLGRQVDKYGALGSVRLDVVEGATSAPTAVFDFKFFHPSRAGYTPPSSRELQIRHEAPLGPIGTGVPIWIIQP